MDRFSHMDNKGRVKMVDVSKKEVSSRYARACGKVFLNEKAYDGVKKGTLKKGEVLAAARIAGIGGAKNTWSLIPLCHPIDLEHVKIDFRLNDEKRCVKIVSEVKGTSKTGVEMEALTAVSIAALTVYDMCKSLDKSMVISDIELIEKIKTPIK
ncbi:MAG: cyclic pyranopterin monophosphate synthase MoaC [Fidelibacterota bacterium]